MRVATAGMELRLQAVDGSVNISGSADEAQSAAEGIYTDYVCTVLGCYIFSHGGGSADGENGVTLSDQFGTLYTDLPANSVYNLDLEPLARAALKAVQIQVASISTHQQALTMEAAFVRRITTL